MSHVVSSANTLLIDITDLTESMETPLKALHEILGCRKATVGSAGRRKMCWLELKV